MEVEMETYVGTKILSAKPMSLGEYNIFRGWTIPEDEDPNKLGYLVQYEDGYKSWSPESTFDGAYRFSGTLNFSHAIHMLHSGRQMYRTTWVDSSFIFLVHGSDFIVNREPLASVLGHGVEVSYHQHIDIWKEGNFVSVWTPTQEDMGASDWAFVVND